MKSAVKHVLILIAVWAVAFWGEVLPAKERGFRFGKLNISPSLKVNGGINTNALYVNGQPESDGVIKISPGVTISAQNHRLNILTGYHFTRDQYFKNTIQNDNQHAFTMNLGIKSYRWEAALNDRLHLTSDPADAEILERIERTENNATGEFSYFSPSKDLKMLFRYSNDLRLFGGDLQALSAYQNLIMVSSRFNISSFFRFLPKTSVQFSAQYTNVLFPHATPGERSIGHGFDFSTGLNGQFTPKLNANINVGYSRLGFDEGPGSQTVTTGLGVGYAWKSLHIKLRYRRSIKESYFTNFYTGNTIELDSQWQPLRKHFSIKLTSSIDWLDYSGNNVLATGEERQDAVFRCGLSFNYQLHRLVNLTADYNVSLRDSNAQDPLTGDSSADFIQHLIMLGVAVYY